ATSRSILPSVGPPTEWLKPPVSTPIRNGSARASLHLQIEPAHQRPPFRLLAIDVLGILLGRRRQRLAALGDDTLLDLLAADQRPQRAIEPLDDRLRRARRRQQPIV